MTGADLAAAAATLVGVQFRLHGRDPVHGLDCVGLVVAALAQAGRAVEVPALYGLRNRSIAPFLALADRAGLAETDPPVAAGDVLLVRPGPAQHHLLIALSADRFVHAHAGLRRVVIQPSPPPWPVERAWRLIAKDT